MPPPAKLPGNCSIAVWKANALPPLISGRVGLHRGVFRLPVRRRRGGAGLSAAANRSLSRIQAIADDAEAKVALTTVAGARARCRPCSTRRPICKQLRLALPPTSCRPATENDWNVPDVHGDTLAFLQYTSGSTGTPKGVMLTPRQPDAQLGVDRATRSNTRRSGSGVFWLPSYHDMGLIGGILQPLYIGAANVLHVADVVPAEAVSLAAGDFELPRHDQRRAEFRLRPVRAQDHARAARRRST